MMRELGIESAVRNFVPSPLSAKILISTRISAGHVLPLRDCSSFAGDCVLIEEAKNTWLSKSAGVGFILLARPYTESS